MRRTIGTLFAIVAGVALTNAAVAQGRHDEKPHGFDAKVVARQATAAQSASGFVTLPSGPRAQDNPLRGKKIAIAQPKNDQKPTTASASPK